MHHGRCTVCKQEINEGESLVVTGITITGGYSLSDDRRSTEVHYAHRTCHTMPTINHVRDAVEANR